MRWLLLDEIVEIRKGISAVSLSRVPKAEFSAEVLLLEMMAQTGGVLLGAENEFKDNVVFAKIEHCTYPIPSIPDEEIKITVSSESLRPEGSWVDGSVESQRGILAQARLMLVCAGEIVPGKVGSITFHEAFLKHFKVRDKIR